MGKSAEPSFICPRKPFAVIHDMLVFPDVCWLRSRDSVYGKTGDSSDIGFLAAEENEETGPQLVERS